MKIFLNKLDSAFQKTVEKFLGVSMVLLTVIVFLQVIFRYVLKTSIGGVEELPLYLMVASVWFAAAILCAENGHIKLDVLTLFVKNKKVLVVIDAVLDFLAVLGLCYFGYYVFLYMLDGIANGTISPGLKFPMWWMTLIMLVNILLMVIYTSKNIITGLGALKHGNPD